MLIDERAERFRPLLNDEFSRDCLGELVGLLTLPSHRLSSYSMMQHGNGPTRMYTPIPYAILDGEDYVPTCGPVYPGATTLPAKADRYRTSEGVLTLEAYNARVRAFTPPSHRFRHLDETWLKYNHTSPLADEMYRLEQEKARKLQGRGASLGPAELAALPPD